MGCAAYLAVGLLLTRRGKLARRLGYTLAITKTYEPLPAAKKRRYKAALWLGVVPAWPVLLISL